MSETLPSKRPFLKREKYLVDKRLQLALALPLGAVPLVVALAYFAATNLMPGEMDLATMTVAETRALYLRTSLMYFGIASAGLGTLAILLTHRIAGPLRVIENAVRAMTKGDLGQRLNLRPSDYLQSLSGALVELRDALRDEQESRRNLAKEVTIRLDQNDLEGARRLLSELGSETDGPE